MWVQTLGISLEDRNEGKTIAIAINESTVLKSYDYYKEHHVLRRETTETWLLSHPYSVAATLALSTSSAVLQKKFDGSPIVVLATVIEPDQYGHPTTYKMFSFTFTKNINSKIDWSGFDAEAFQTIVPDSHYTDWFTSHFVQEPLR